MPHYVSAVASRHYPDAQQQGPRNTATQASCALVARYSRLIHLHPTGPSCFKIVGLIRVRQLPLKDGRVLPHCRCGARPAALTAIVTDSSLIWIPQYTGTACTKPNQMALAGPCQARQGRAQTRTTFTYRWCVAQWPQTKCARDAAHTEPEASRALRASQGAAHFERSPLGRIGVDCESVVRVAHRPSSSRWGNEAAAA